MTVLVFFVLVVITLLFNRNGIMAISALRAEMDLVSRTIDSLDREIDSLEMEIDMLLADSAYMEQVVRSVLGWGREGEYIIRFTPYGEDTLPVSNE